MSHSTQLLLSHFGRLNRHNAPQLIGRQRGGSTSAGTTGQRAVPQLGRRRRQQTGKAVDARLAVGATVHTKAVHITNLAELSRFRGASARTFHLDGAVLQVVCSKGKVGRNKTERRTSWVLRGRTVEKLLGLASVREGPAPPHELLADHSAVELGTPANQTCSPCTQTVDNVCAPLPPPAVGGQALPAPPHPARAGFPPPPTGTTVTTLPQGAGSASPHPRRPVTPAVSTAHGLTWTPRAVSEPIGCPVPRQMWSVPSPGGEVIQEGGVVPGPGQTRRPYDYFWAMLPMDQLTRIVLLTSSKLEARGMQRTNGGEVLKWVGVTLLATRYEFGARADLWATLARSKCMLAPAFGERTGMS